MSLFTSVLNHRYCQSSHSWKVPRITGGSQGTTGPIQGKQSGEKRLSRKLDRDICYQGSIMSTWLASLTCLMIWPTYSITISSAAIGSIANRPQSWIWLRLKRILFLRNWFIEHDKMRHVPFVNTDPTSAFRSFKRLCSTSGKKNITTTKSVHLGKDATVEFVSFFLISQA